MFVYSTYDQIKIKVNIICVFHNRHQLIGKVGKMLQTKHSEELEARAFDLQGAFLLTLTSSL